MYNIGISTTFNMKFNDETFYDFKKNDISFAELSLTALYKDYVNFDYKNAKSLSEKYGVDFWSMHLPFGPFEMIDPSSMDKDVRKNTIEKLSELIKIGGDMGIDKFVIHPSGEPIEDIDREERKKYSRETLSLLADVSEKSNGVICVEDLPRSCIGHSIEEMKFLTNEDERLTICFDTNHINIKNPEDVILALGEKIVTLHVSDFDFINERHWLPGEGKINWNNVVDALKTINYKGAWMYEISFDCPKTILRDRRLTAYDLKRNATEILSKEKPTIFSKQKPNLGMWE